jgi:tetratricopeptide (TPR) repeat protein
MRSSAAPQRVRVPLVARGPRRHVVGAVALVALAVAAGRANAGPLTDFSQAELLTLPRVCLAQRFINQELTTPVVPDAERTQRAETLGRSYIHFHHYCWALLYIARAEQPQGDKFNFRRAVDNLDYVIRHADPSFTLLPQVYVLKGDVLARTGKGDAAATEYRNAIQADRTYAAAYAALALYFLDAGDPTAAREVLTDARRNDASASPGSTPAPNPTR